MADRIELRGLVCPGFHGVFATEKKQGQDFIVDVTAWMDFPRTDDLDQTLNYAELAQLAYGIVVNGPVRDLIETVANDIAAAIMERYEFIHAVEVTVHKPQAPIPIAFEDVAVVARLSRKKIPPSAPPRSREAVGNDEPGPRTPLTAVLSIGSNMHDRVGLLRSVLDEFDGEILATSGLWSTPPWGDTDQPDFLNAIVIVQTASTPLELLHRGQRLEEKAMRARVRRWGPRTLDVDIIAVTDALGAPVESSSAELTLPHPYCGERAFVLVPWLEADPHAQLRGVPVDRLIADVDSSGMRRVATPEEFRSSVEIVLGDELSENDPSENSPSENTEAQP